MLALANSIQAPDIAGLVGALLRFELPQYAIHRCIGERVRSTHGPTHSHEQQNKTSRVVHSDFFPRQFKTGPHGPDPAPKAAAAKARADVSGMWPESVRARAAAMRDAHERSRNLLRLRRSFSCGFRATGPHSESEILSRGRCDEPISTRENSRSRRCADNEERRAREKAAPNRRVPVALPHLRRETP